MSKYFTSVLKLVESADTENGADNSTVSMQVDVEESKISVHLPSDQPHPLNCSSKPVSLSYDKILPPGVTGSALYKQTAKEVVESTLLGYHGTVITFSSSKTKKEQSDLVWSPVNGMVQKATKQIIRCLKKSQALKSKSSTTNLVILCSYVLVVEEEVRDLLRGFSSKKQSGKDLPPKLASRELSSTSQRAVTTGAEVSAMLRYGQNKQVALDSSVTLDATPTTTRQQRHHTIFTLTVEFSQFGSMNAPVSGNLQFVDLAVADPLASRQRFTRGDKVDSVMLSLFSFADVVESLSSNVAVLDTMRVSDSAFNRELETAFLPHVPTPPNPNPHEKSVLTRLLRESLGGNCKTLLVTFAPMQIPASLHSEVLESLKLASRARIIQNTPNKRDLAEKALMSAYLRGLEEMYGQAVVGGKDERNSEVAQNSGSKVKTEEDDKCETDDFAGTQRESLRQRNMEMAATALVAAALEGGEGDSEESGSEEESGGSFVWGDGEVARRKSRSKALTCDGSRDVEPAVLIMLNEEQNVTLQTLVAILQDPDKGVPRPSPEALSNVKIKKDAGALFSGSAIVQWLLTNISGVRTERDAEMLGQMLLDSGHIFHSEGSRVFADADTLFYHVRCARTSRQSLSLDEILALLKTAGSLEEREADSTAAGRLKAGSVGGTAGSQEQEELELRDIEEVDFGEGASLSAVREDPAAASVNMLGQESSATLPFDTHSTGLELRDVESASLDGELEEGAAKTEMQEEWMAGSGEEDNETMEEELTGPNTAPLRRLPTLQTLESSVNYPHPLHMAVAIGKTPAVVRELVMMFGVNQQDTSCRTPLMFAALGNKGSSCGTLLRCAAEVDLQDVSGLTALHVACYHGNKSAASVLLSNKASIATRDKLGHSALHWSMVPQDPGCLQLLTRHSMHPDLLNHADTNGLTAVHWSIFYNHSQHLSHLLKRYNKSGCINLTALDSEGRTFALYAIEKHSASCLKVLLDASPALLTLPGPGHEGSTLLHHSALQDTGDCLRILLDYRPPKNCPVQLDLNQTDHSLWTCLHYAVAYYRLESAAILVSRGARVDMEDSEGKTVVDHAESLEEGKEDLLAVLRGESVNGCKATMNDGDAMKEIEELPRSKFCLLL